MNAWRQPGFWLTFLLVLVGGGTVLVLQDSTLRELVFTLLMFVALSSSLNIMMGYTGYVNFGHIVFFGLGGYTGFYLISQHGWPLYTAALVGGCLSALIAALLGAAILRLRGAYFALATIGINEAFRSFFTNFDLFGGAVGMFFNFAVYDAYGGAKNAGQLAYYAMVGLALATIATSFLIKKSKFGLGLMAIREDL